MDGDHAEATGRLRELGGIQDLLPLPYQSLDSNGRLLNVNEKWLEKLGYCREEVIGHWFGEFLTPEFSELFRERFERFKRVGAVENFDFRMLRKDGGAFETLFNGVAEYDDGEFIRTHCLVNDVSALREAEEALRNSETLLRTILAQSPDMVYIADLGTGKASFFNRELFLGYSREELEGPHSIVSAVHPEDAEAVAEHWRQAASSREEDIASIEYRLRSKSGAWEWVQCRPAVLERGPDGNPKRLLVTLTVTTKRKRMESELQTQRDRAKRYLDIASVIMVAIDREGRITLLNKKGCALLGCGEGDLLGEDWFSTCIPERMRAEVRTVFDQLMREEVDLVERYENPVLDAEGQERLIAWHNTLLRGADGAIAGTLSSGTDVTERRLAEARLQENERILSDILESTLSGYWDWNIPEGTEYFSPAFKAMFGFEDHELENRPETWQRLIHPDDLPGVLELFDRHVESRGAIPFHNEVRYRHKDGSTIWVICAGRVIEWAEDGSPIRMVGCHVDITERRDAEIALERSLADWQTTFDASNDAIWLLDTGQRVVRCNRRTEEVFGVPCADVLGRRCWEIVHGTTEPIPECPVVRARQSRQRESMELPIGNRWFEVTADPTLDETGAYTGSVHNVRDITAAKAADAALRESERRYRSLFENELDAILVLDMPSRRIIDANPAAEALYGYSKAEFVELHAEDLSAEPERTVVAIDDVIEGEQALVPDRRHRRKDGSIVRVEISATVYELGGRTVNCSIVRDVTERRRAEEEIRRTTQRLRDLRTELDHAIEDERRRIARELHDQVSQNLTALSITAGSMVGALSEAAPDLQHHVEDCQALIEETAGHIRDLTFELRPPVLDDFGLLAAIEWHRDRVVGKSALRVHISGKEPDPRLSGNAEMALFRIVQEALTNVVKHAHAQSVWIDVASDEGSFELILRDDGQGLDASEGFGGGWGLLNMRERAEALDGTFEIESSAGAGTTLRVRVPR